MKRVYRIFMNNKEMLVIADSKKVVRSHFNIKEVAFWCNITKKNSFALRNLQVL